MIDKIYHEYDDEGHHRLVVSGIAGKWARYQDPASHPHGYMAFTEYFGERVIRFQTVQAETRSVTV